MKRAMIFAALTAIFLLTIACGSSEEPTPAREGGQAPSRSERVPTSAPAATAAPASRSQPAEATRAPAAPQSNRAPTSAPAPTYAPPASSQGRRSAAPPPRDESGGQGQPSATTFRDYGRLEFTETEVDSVSTFSLDADRSSYHLALSWARDGYEVDPSSVRAEEWINAFNYQYDPPEDGGSFSITTDVFRHPLDDRRHMARIGFQAPELLDATPLNVTLVLDASGSMKDGNRVDIARAAAESIRNSLSGRDRIAVVHFNTDVKHDLTVEHRQPDDRSVEQSIDRLQPGGSTNVQAGLNEAVWLADQARRDRPDAYNYIILMSDGVANVDATDPFAILGSSPDRDARNPLRIITIGVGIQNYNDVLLEQIAQYGNGWYRYLDNPEQAEATFSRDNWLALSTPFADQTRAQVTWDPGVVRTWRIVGYENRVTSDESFTEERKEFAEIYSGASTTVFYELELWGEAGQARTADLGTVEVRWTDPITGRPWRQHTTVSGHPDTDFDLVSDALVQLGAIVALSSDLYSGVPDFTRQEFSYLSTDMYALLDRLSGLNRSLGRLQAYNDFYFLLEHIAADVSEITTQAPSGTGSGYNR
jgi:Ca-activated chloride channel family protein